MESFDIKQKILIWILILVGVFILSDFLIYVGLNSTYKDIQRKDDNSKIVVYQAEATYVNGRIRGIIIEPDDLKKQYLKVELYSSRDVLLGQSYIEIQDTQNNLQNNTQPFEVLFKVKDVAYYKMEPVQEKTPGTELEIIPKELTRSEVLLATAITFLIFWG